MGIEGANPKATLAETEALPADKLGIVSEPSYNYASVVGMLQYLQGHTRLDISCAVSQCSRYIHRHTNMHIMAMKRIGRYLLKTSEKGIILKPTSDLTIDCYVDADFAGLWNWVTTMMTIVLKQKWLCFMHQQLCGSLDYLASRWNCTQLNGIRIFSIVHGNVRLVAIQTIGAIYLYRSGTQKESRN